MNQSIYYCKIFDISNANKGLCNQLFALVSGIIIAIKNKKRTVVLDHFLIDYKKNDSSAISYLIDVGAFSTFLQNNYRITVCDRTSIPKHETIHPGLFQYTFYWINHLDRTMFDHIMKNIPFVPFLNQLASEFIQPKIITPNQKINVLHLRLEDDAFDHWSKQNYMDKNTFQKVIYKKYIDLIDKYLNKEDINIILSFSTQNKVIDHLRDQGYKYFFSEKRFPGREVNAALDLNIGSHCNNIFIGNFNLEHLNGSSLSYVLLNRLKDKHITKILIDLDHILEEPKKY